MTGKLPWEPGFVAPVLDTNLLGSVTKAVEQGVQDATTAATSLGANVAGAVAGPTAATAVTDLGKVATDVEQGVGQVITPTSAPAPAPSAPVAAPATPVAPVGGIVSTLEKDLEDAALSAAKQAAISAAPSLVTSLEGRIAKAAQVETKDFLTKLQGGSTEPATPDLTDFTKADARSRAIRTLLTGLGLSVLWGLVNILGNVATTDWTNRDALPQVLSLAVGSVISSVAAYIERTVKEPAHITNATIIPADKTG